LQMPNQSLFVKHDIKPAVPSCKVRRTSLPANCPFQCPSHGPHTDRFRA